MTSNDQHASFIYEGGSQTSSSLYPEEDDMEVCNAQYAAFRNHATQCEPLSTSTTIKTATLDDQCAQDMNELE